MIRVTLVPRTTSPRLALVTVSLATIALSIVTAAVLFSAYGAAPLGALYSLFIEPLSSPYNLGEVAIKASPLILIAQGLALGFQARVWNIGGEGQLIIGACAASCLPIFLPESDSAMLLPAMIVTGALAGMLWASVAAVLRTAFNASEIIVTLMLTEVAKQILYYLITGPLRDPAGFNFPQSVPFQDAALFSTFGGAGSRANYSVSITIAVSVISWIFVKRSFEAFRLQIGGVAPDAADYAGFSRIRAIWLSLLVSGACAGLAGVGEVAGPIGKLQPILTPGYGYTAIIVAFLGGLSPVGVVLSGVFLAIIYVGGDNSLASSKIPAAVPNVMQGLILVYYLSLSVFLRNELRVTFRRTARALA